MTWRLFIDDERQPEDVAWAPWHVKEMYRNDTFIIVRSVDEAVEKINSLGFPVFVSFDHDLGKSEAKTGFDLARLMVDMDLDGVIRFPEDFDFYVHSKNPVGKANIENLLSSYFKFS